MNINELMSNIQVLVPFRNAFESDNVGLVIGSEKEEVKKIIVAHDLTIELLNHCIDQKINCVIVIFL